MSVGLKTFLACLLVCAVTSLLSAEQITSTCRITAVDAGKRTITLVRNTPSGERTGVARVAENLEVQFDGESIPFTSLGPPVDATVVYDSETRTIVRIRAADNSKASAESIPVQKVDGTSIVEVSELQGVFAPCFSENGLTIYFSRMRKGGGWDIFTAHRKDPDSRFKDERVLIEGLLPAVTNDGLEMIFSGTKVRRFEKVSRDSVTDPFGRPEPIAELKDPPEARAYSRGAVFSPDELTMYFQSYSQANKTDLVYVTRLDRRAPWSKPMPVPLKENAAFMHLSCPLVTSDGLRLYCVNEESFEWMNKKGNLLRFSRSSLTEPFTRPEFVGFEGLPKPIGRFPAYIPATKEFYFCQAEKDQTNIGITRLMLIRNFVP